MNYFSIYERISVKKVLLAITLLSSLLLCYAMEKDEIDLPDADVSEEVVAGPIGELSPMRLTVLKVMFCRRIMPYVPNLFREGARRLKEEKRILVEQMGEVKDRCCRMEIDLNKERSVAARLGTNLFCARKECSMQGRFFESVRDSLRRLADRLEVARVSAKRMREAVPGSDNKASLLASGRAWQEVDTWGELSADVVRTATELRETRAALERARK